MRKTFAVAIVTAAVVGAVVLAVTQPASAGTVEPVSHEYRFTKTLDSAFSPGQGHETHQIVRILEPSDGVIYSGVLTYVASHPIDIVVIHEMDADDSRGQAIWRIDDDTVYGWTFLDIDSKAGQFEYAGAGLFLHSGGEEFTATVTAQGTAKSSQALDIVPTPVVP